MRIICSKVVYVYKGMVFYLEITIDSAGGNKQTENIKNKNMHEGIKGSIK